MMKSGKDEGIHKLISIKSLSDSFALKEYQYSGALRKD